MDGEEGRGFNNDDIRMQGQGQAYSASQATRSIQSIRRMSKSTTSVPSLREHALPVTKEVKEVRKRRLTTLAGAQVGHPSAFPPMMGGPRVGRRDAAGPSRGNFESLILGRLGQIQEAMDSRMDKLFHEVRYLQKRVTRTHKSEEKSSTALLHHNNRIDSTIRKRFDEKLKEQVQKVKDHGDLGTKSGDRASSTKSLSGLSSEGSGVHGSGIPAHLSAEEIRRGSKSERMLRRGQSNNSGSNRPPGDWSLNQAVNASFDPHGKVNERKEGSPKKSS